MFEPHDLQKPFFYKMSGRIVIKSQLSGNQLPFASAPIRARLFYPPSKFFDGYFPCFPINTQNFSNFHHSIHQFIFRNPNFSQKSPSISLKFIV
ncbi:hypothetical protein IC582_021317 [Cucumis melo]